MSTIKVCQHCATAFEVMRRGAKLIAAAKFCSRGCASRSRGKVELSPEKRAEYNRRYVERHPERRAQSIADSNASEKTKASKAAYRDRNREKLRAAGRTYVASNRPAMNAALAAYRAAKLQATPTWANKSAIAEFYKDARARALSTGAVHHVDHVIPLVSDEVCGLHVEFNLEVLEGVENQRKGNRIWPRE